MAGLKVWITGGGHKYHATGDCSALTEGQMKARRDGWEIHVATWVNLSDKACKGREPCSQCWPDTPGWTDWSYLEHRVIRLGDSAYETDFLNNVLRDIPGMRPGDVEAQHEFDYGSDKGRIDFAVLRDGVKLAIEVDGLSKSPTGQPVDASTHSRMTRRQNALQTQGWTVLRFPNNDVLLCPDACRKQVEEALANDCPRPVQAGAASAVPRHAEPGPERPGPASPPGAPAHHPESQTTTPPASRRSTRSRGSIVGVVVVGGFLIVVAAVVAAISMSASAGSSGSKAPVGSTCPADFPIKGNESDSGELIYHEPGWEYYGRTNPERCFADADAAEDAGYRASEVH